MTGEVLVGVTGGISAYKTAMLVSQLAQQGIGVTVVMTAAAGHFVGPTTFRALSGRPVYGDLFADEKTLGSHIELAAQADLLCVAPATANFLAKAAHGLADDLLTTLYLAFSGPVILAPAMSCDMWEHPAVRRNVQRLRDDGNHFVGPEEGWLACRRRGWGRMSDPANIAAAIAEKLTQIHPLDQLSRE